MLLVSHDILVANMKFLNKLFNLLIVLSCLDMESRIGIILKYVSGISEVLDLNVSGTLKALIIYQYFITALYEIIPWMVL